MCYGGVFQPQSRSHYFTESEQSFQFITFCCNFQATSENFLKLINSNRNLYHQKSRDRYGDNYHHVLHQAELC